MEARKRLLERGPKTDSQVEASQVLCVIGSSSIARSENLIPYPRLPHDNS
jgi:hypothetical protein